MNDLTVAQINNAALCSLHDLNRAAASTEAAHLQHIDNMKQVRRVRGCVFRPRHRAEQSFSIDRLWENFCLRHLKPLLRGRISWKKCCLQPGKNFAQRAPQHEPVDSFGFELGEKEPATRMAAGPFHSRGVVVDEIAIVRRVIFHHLHQLAAEFGVMVHNEQFHQGDAVDGGG